MARWNLTCTCGKYEPNVTCSIYAIPNCECGAERTISYDSSARRSAVFPFVVNHVDGQPMTIESMHHLRKIEKDYGVVFSAFSKNSLNDPDAVDKELPKFRGDDPDTRYNHRERYNR